MDAQQMKLLAGLEVTTKAVERMAEAIGEDIARARASKRFDRAMQLDLPIIVGEPDSHPVCANGRHGRAGGEERDGGPAKARPTASRPTRGKSSWDACSRKPAGTRKATRSAIPIPPPIPAPSRPPKSSASASTWKPGIAAGAAPKRKSSWATGPNGSGILPSQHFPGAVQIVDLYHARQHLWELARKLYPNDASEPESLDQGPSETAARQGENRKTGGASLHSIPSNAEAGREDPHRGRLL